MVLFPSIISVVEDELVLIEIGTYSFASYFLMCPYKTIFLKDSSQELPLCQGILAMSTVNAVGV